MLLYHIKLEIFLVRGYITPFITQNERIAN